MLRIYPTLEDYLTVSLIDGIFDKIRTLSAAADGHLFEDENTSLMDEYDIEYYYHSFRKPLTMRFYKLLEELKTNGTLSTFAESFASLAYSRFGYNWEKAWESYFLITYRPQDNYDMEEKETPDLAFETNADRAIDTTTTTDGSTSSVPFNETESTLIAESTGSATTTADKTKNKDYSKTTHTGTKTITKHGNIGVKSTVELLDENLKFRKMDFVNRVFHDLDSLLCRHNLT